MRLLVDAAGVVDAQLELGAQTRGEQRRHLRRALRRKIRFRGVQRGALIAHRPPEPFECLLRLARRAGEETALGVDPFVEARRGIRFAGLVFRQRLVEPRFRDRAPAVELAAQHLLEAS